MTANAKHTRMNLPQGGVAAYGDFANEAGTLRPRFDLWRIYLYLHLAILTAIALLLWCDSHAVEVPTFLAIGISRVVGYGGIFITASPFVLIYLTNEGLRRNRRYLTIAGAEALMSAAHLFAALTLCH